MSQHAAIDAEETASHATRGRVSALAAIVLAALGTVLAAAALDAALALGGSVARRAALSALAGGALLGVLAVRHFAAASFGAANTITLARAALAMLLVALIGAPASAALGWLMVGLGTMAAVLDGVDGRLARGRGEANAFGARFDLETDALTILVLAVLAWQFGKAGVWVLLAGLLRYLFVGSSYVWPWLERPLPASRRRQTVCVLQIATLIASLAPIFVRPFSDAVALAGLALLVWSFSVDTAWLFRRARA